MSRETGSSFVMFVMGIAVGAVAAALYTPVTGSALRRRLSRVKDEGIDLAEDALSQAGGFVREKTKAAKTLVTRAGDAFQKARDEATDGAE